jgi:hypothetical protein
LAYTKNVFLPSNFSVASLKSFAETIRLGNETVLLRGLLGTVYTLITDLQHIEDAIYKEKKVGSRIGKLDESAERRKSLYSELSASLQTLADLMGHAAALSMSASSIASQPGLKLFTDQQNAVMGQLFESGEKACNWASSVDEQLLSCLDVNTQVNGVGLSSAGSSEALARGRRDVSLQNGPLDPSMAFPSDSNSSVNASKMEKLRKQAEVSLALFVSAQSREERKNGLDAIDAMLKVIQTELEVAQIRGTGGVKELTELKEYMLQGKAFQLQDANTLVSQSDIQFFEDTLYSFIGTLSSLEKMPLYPQHSQSPHILSAPGSDDEVNHSRSTDGGDRLSREEVATKLMKETDQLRSALASSRIALEKHQQTHPEDQSVINLVNRITDIQEHLVEVQYQLKSKYLPSVFQAPSNPHPRPTRSLDDEFEL